MNPVNLVCKYCTHHNPLDQASCTHCGAPLQAVADGAKKVAVEVAEVLTSPVAAGAVAAVGMGAWAALRKFPKKQWIAAAIVVVAVAILGLTLAFVLSSGVPKPDPIPVVAQLPDPLRSAAVCKPHDVASGSEKCTVAAEDPMLWGRVAGGRDLTFYMQVAASREQLAATITQWRAGGGTVVADKSIVIIIAPAGNVHYANTKTGLRLDTGTFSSRAAAQTFLARAGLG